MAFKPSARDQERLSESNYIFPGTEIRQSGCSRLGTDGIEWTSVKKNMMAGLRILIVDDEKAVRTALGRLLGTREEWVVVGEAADGAEAIGKAKELKPDVVIMDVTLPELNGLAATPEIKKAIPSAEILIFTQHESSQIIREARNAGASGYLLKSQANWLVAAVEAIGQHKPFFGGKNLSAAR
jgi:CheY-like chemotaxis protein